MGRPHGVAAEGMFPPFMNVSRKANTVSAVIGQVSNSVTRLPAPPPPLIPKPIPLLLLSDSHSPLLAYYVWLVALTVCICCFWIGIRVWINDFPFDMYALIPAVVQSNLLAKGWYIKEFKLYLAIASTLKPTNQRHSQMNCTSTQACDS